MSTPTIQPLADRIIVARVQPKEKAPEKIIDGIIIPNSAQASTLAGIENPHDTFDVIAVGEACKVVKAGNRVVVRNIDCFPVQVGDVAQLMCREPNVVAILNAASA